MHMQTARFCQKLEGCVEKHYHCGLSRNSEKSAKVPKNRKYSEKLKKSKRAPSPTLIQLAYITVVEAITAFLLPVVPLVRTGWHPLSSNGQPCAYEKIVEAGTCAIALKKAGLHHHLGYRYACTQQAFPTIKTSLRKFKQANQC